MTITNAITAAEVVFFSYLIGSLPFGYLSGRLAGIDIRQVGSGNVGATNVLRSLGKRWGYPVFAADAAKGAAAVLFGKWIGSRSGVDPSGALLPIFAAFGAVLGHSFSLWLSFKGGKGVATSAGALLILMPWALLGMLAIWSVIFQRTRIVSVASLSAAVALPGLALILPSANKGSLTCFSLAIAMFVIWAHRSNIRRLFLGLEPRFSRH